MSKTTNSCNKLSIYRQKRKSGPDRAFTVVNGKRTYLGEYGTPESYQLFSRIMAEWSTSGIISQDKKDDLTIIELMDLFIQWAKKYYSDKAGNVTPNFSHYKAVVKILNELYGDLQAREFSPLKATACRGVMIQKGWCRKYVNAQMGRLKNLFKWGVEREIVPSEVFHSLQAIRSLQAGRTEARETERVVPVPESHIDAIQPYVSRPVWALIRLQLCTGARGGELLSMKATQIDMTDKIWLYTPPSHKTAHHGHDRTIFIGPKGQRIIKEFLANRALGDYLFSPLEGNAERKSLGTTKGRRPDQQPNPKKTERSIGLHYSPASYRRAIQRACEQAGIPKWHPHQLRHNSGTHARREFGLEGSQLLLGHRNADVTQIYAETNRQKALEIAQKIG